MPRSNLRNLMLRADVVNAVKEGKFHIYAVSSADDRHRSSDRSSGGRAQ